MKVHISSTPEVNFELLDKVVDSFKSVSGEIDFEKLVPYDFDTLSVINDQFETPENITSLEFVDFFKTCNLIRKLNKIPANEFIVVLTSIPNKYNWFSAFDNFNIFVHTQDWVRFTEQQPHSAIAYQIIENIFQSLMKLDINNCMEEPNIHHVPIGCINDMCKNKKEVIFKLRMGYICNSCFERALSKNVSDKVLLHIYRIIQALRKEFMNFNDILKILKPYYITVHKNFISIGNKKINFGVLDQTLFRFFLNHLEGVPSLYDENNKYLDEILVIYTSLKKGADHQKFRKTIELLCHWDYDQSTFSKVKNDLNNKLKEIIEDELLKYYTINECNRDQKGSKVYKIEIPKMYIRYE